jgi:lipopolysaccharide export system permease protein
MDPQVETSGQVKTITAKEGKILYDPNASVILLELKEGTIQEPTGEYFKEFYNVQFGSYIVKLDVSKLFQTPKTLNKKHKDMTISEIKEKIQQFQAQGINATPLFTEIQRKIAISFSCLVFALIGIPLGIRAHRSEKTVGVGLGLLLFFLYYLFIILGKGLDEKPQFHPELLMWLPNVLLVAIGIYLLRRISK